MWQRFTMDARKAIFHAQEEAQYCKTTYVCTEHLLLGLIKEETVATTILLRFGVEVDQIRPKVEELVTQQDPPNSKDMTLTSRAKRVIDLAYEEAQSLRNNYIGVEHILLGLLSEGEGVGGRALTELGMELDATRYLVAKLQAETKA